MIKIEQYAKENKIPIMEKEGILFVMEFIKEHNIKTILEIGSAIGYSSIKMASVNENIKITTIERDEVRYNEAVKNIKEYNLQTQITIHNIDAFDYEDNQNYDMLLIDAAKAQNIKFFEKFKKEIKYILTDNIDFHGLVNQEYIESRNLRQLIRKTKNYINFLNENQEYTTTYIKVGDTIALSERNKYGTNE